MRAFLDILRKADFVGPYPEITHNGKIRFQTLFGSSLTILSLLITLVISLSEFDRVVYNKNPNFYTQINSDNTTYQLSAENLKVFFKFVYFDFNTSTFKTLNYSEKPELFVGRSTYNDVHYDFSYISSSKIDNIYDLVPCSDKFRNDVKLTNHSSQTPFRLEMEGSLCFPPKMNETLKRSSSGIDAISLSVKNKDLYRLIPGLSYTPFALRMYYQELKISPDIPADPYTLIWKYETFFIDLSKFLQVEINIQNIQASWDVTKFLKKEGGDRTFDIITSIPTTINIRRQETFKIDEFYDNAYYILFQKHSNKVKYTLVYSSVETLLGNLGGTLMMFMKFSEMIAYFIISPLRHYSRITQVINFHENLQDDKIINSVINCFVNGNTEEHKTKNSFEDKDTNLKQSLHMNEPGMLENKDSNTILVDQHAGEAPPNLKEENFIQTTEMKLNTCQVQEENKELNIELTETNGVSPCKVNSSKLDLASKSKYSLNRLFSTLQQIKAEDDPIIVNGDDKKIVQELLEKKGLCKVKRTLDENNAVTFEKCNFKELDSNAYLSLLSHKKESSIGKFDVLKHRFSCCVKFKKTMMIDSILHIMNKTIDETFITRSLIEHKLLLGILFDEKRKALFRIPSINLECQNISYLRYFDDMKTLEQQYEIAKSLNTNDHIDRRLVEFFLRSNL